MNNKQEILQTIADALDQKVIQVSDLMQFMPGNDQGQAAQRHDGTGYNWIQYLGAIVVLLGVAAFVGQFWEDLGTVGHVAVTLGGSWAAYALGSYLMRADSQSHAGVAFHVIGWVLMPAGLGVFMSEALDMTDGSLIALIISIVMLLVYGIIARLQQHYIYVFFAATAAVGLVYSGLFHMAPDVEYEIVSLITMAIGSLTMLAGYKFRDMYLRPLSDVMYSLGVLGTLVGAASLFGSRTLEIPSVVLFPFICAGVFYLMHNHLHSKRGFVITVVGVMGYIIYITSEYFADTVGWPIALIITGIILIAVGYKAVAYSKSQYR